LETAVADSASAGRDVVLYIGVAVTFVLGMFNLWHSYVSSRRTAFVNVVTAERIKWIQKVRENIALLCTLSEQWVRHPNGSNLAELSERLERLKNEVRLQLNPEDAEDQDLERFVLRLPSWTNAITPEDFDTLETLIVGATKRMLKREWDKVKDEAQKGDLRTRAARRRSVG
jgi:hypothetical protein